MYFDPNQRLLQISIHYKFAEILFKVYVCFGFGSDIYKVWGVAGGVREIENKAKLSQLKLKFGLSLAIVVISGVQVECSQK